MDIPELQVDSLKHLSPEEWEQVSQLLLEHDDAFLSLCRQDINTFIEYIMVDESTGQPVKQSAIHEDWHTLADLHPQLVILSHPEGGKCVSTENHLPFSGGFKRFGDVKVGDIVYGSDGKPTKVTYVSPVQTDLETYEIEFENGVKIKACADHQWLAKNKLDIRDRADFQVVNTKHLYETQRVYTSQQADWSIPLPKPVQYPRRDLPIDPYILGVWLGDGFSNKPMITIGKADEQLIELLKDRTDCGEPRLTRKGTAYRLSIGLATRGKGTGLRAVLKNEGLLNNKHIPATYLTASVEQRMSLLRGLLDTGGAAVRGRPRVSFAASDERMAKDVLELCRSLGYKAGLTEYKPKRKNESTCYKVEFNTRKGKLFLVDRKQTVLDEGRAETEPCTRDEYLKIVNIVPCESESMICISVDNKDRSYLISRDYLVTHNTQQFAVGRSLWLLGHNPRLRISILCDTQQQAKKIVKVIAEHIENNPRLREVFPRLRKGQKWSETQLYVERPSGIKEPSVQACGTHGDIHGARIDYLLIDDILNSDNTRTAYMREEMKRWVRNSAYTRMTENGRIVFLANAWHPDDLAHEQARMKGWKTKKYPVLDSNGNTTWPEKFPNSRIEKIKDSMGTLNFTRQYLCEARDDSSARFKQEYIDRCLENGNGISLIEDVRQIMEGDPDWNWGEEDYNSAAGLGAVHEDPIRGYLASKGYQVFTGVDLAIQKHSAADLTVFFTILQYPKVWSPKQNKYLGGERQILNIESGRWTAPEIIDRIENIYDRFPGWFIIENVAAQDYILQFMRHRNKDIPIKPFTTGRQKADPTFGIESLASEFELGSWIFPNDGGVMHDEVKAYVEECLFYHPAQHTGDRLMASWFAREGARMLRPKDTEEDGDVGVRIVGGSNKW